MSYDILSLDLGTSFGFATISDGVLKTSGVVKLPPADPHPGHRFIKFGQWLSSQKKVKEIFYEIVPRFESAKSARVYCGLLAMVQMFCLQHGIKLTGIYPTSVKLEFTGNGHAKKPLMCEVAHKLGWKGGHPATDIDHDECDAIACAWVILNRRDVKLNFEGATR